MTLWWLSFRDGNALITEAESLAHARLLAVTNELGRASYLVEGRPIVFEINARFSGGIPLTIEAGADFPRMLARLALGRRVAPSIGRFRDNVWMTNYETSVFLKDGDIRLEPSARRGAIEEVA